MQLARDGLGADEYRRERGDDSEHSERDCQRFDGPIHLGLDRLRRMEFVRRSRGDPLDELPFDGRNTSIATIELQSVIDDVPGPLVRVGDHLSTECRGDEDEGRELVDVVLDDPVGHLDQSDQLRIDAPVGWNSRCAEGRQALLLRGVDAVGNHLTDMESEQMSRGRRHDDLIGSIWVGHPALSNRQAVLVEEQAVDAAKDERRLQGVGVETRRPVRLQRGRGQERGTLHMPHTGQILDRFGGGWGVGHIAATVLLSADDRHAQVGRVRACQEGGEGGLRAPGRHERAQGQSTDEADENDDGQVVASATTECDPEPVPGDSEVPAGHCSPRPGSFRVTSR